MGCGSACHGETCTHITQLNFRFSSNRVGHYDSSMLESWGWSQNEEENELYHVADPDCFALNF